MRALLWLLTATSSLVFLVGCIALLGGLASAAYAGGRSVVRVLILVGLVGLPVLSLWAIARSWNLWSQERAGWALATAESPLALAAVLSAAVYGRWLGWV